MNNDIALIWRTLLPALRPYLWPILLSLGITGLVIGADLLQPYCFKWLIDAATLQMNYQLVLILLLGLLGLAIIRSILSYVEVYARSKVGEGIAAQYRKKLFEHILHLPLATLHEMDSGVLVNRIMNECGVVGRVYVTTQLLPTATNMLQTLALVTLLLLLNWQVGLASIVVFPLGWLFAQRVTKRSRVEDEKLRSLGERGLGILQEIISGIREVRAVANEEGEIQRWDSWLHSYRRIICKTSTEHEFLRTTLNKLINWVGLCIVYGLGVWQLLQHHMTVGTLLATGLYVQQLYATLATMLSMRIQTGQAANALQSIETILAMPREWPEQGKRSLGEVRGELEFDHVSFHYDASAGNVQDISFKNPPGQVLGIVGPSGAGKSTLINLCMRFYNPVEGAILLDGQNIADMAAHELRRHIGLVSQDIFLWDATIRENLLYGLRRQVPWEQVLEICKKAHVHAFVQHLPQGYETVIGSRGVKLSGGEKQRIALARVLLRDPKIILLDEATAALDSITEAAITNTLLHAFEKKSRILVAHRLATVQGADQICVVQDGKIIEMGPPKVLAQQQGVYAQFYHSQKLAFE